MKKILALLLALVMVFSLAACSGGGSNEPAQTGGDEPSGGSRRLRRAGRSAQDHRSFVCTNAISCCQSSRLK